MCACTFIYFIEYAGLRTKLHEFHINNKEKHETDLQVYLIYKNEKKKHYMYKVTSPASGYLPRL